MRLEELYKVVKEDIRMVIYTGCENVPIAVYDGRESMPRFLNQAEIYDIMPTYENGKEYFKVILSAEYTTELICGALETLLRNRLNDLENGENVGNVLLNIESFIDEINDFRQDL